ncbi:MAG: hypothetical protein NZ952_02970 [Candidatus Bathyarchaeota archaeon]|nr:hypothetical protein [Candidatus Bathyarchaeota archaeon]
MDRLLTCRLILFAILMSILLLAPNVSAAHAFIEPILIGTDPRRDANPASVDILYVYLTNNGTHFRFIVNCSTTPQPSLIRLYRVYLDTRDGGDQLYGGADFYLQAGGNNPGLYEWVSGTWIYRASIEITIVGYSIRLTTSLSGIGYPEKVKSTIGVIVVTFSPNLRDRAPNFGSYSVTHEVIPELPWPTPLLFIPAVTATVYLIYKWRFRRDE